MWTNHIPYLRVEGGNSDFDSAQKAVKHGEVSPDASYHNTAGDGSVHGGMTFKDYFGASATPESRAALERAMEAPAFRRPPAAELAEERRRRVTPLSRPPSLGIDELEAAREGLGLLGLD